jgi:hypothetical protein
MIRCRELAALAADFLAEELPTPQRERVRAHLRWRPACIAEMER